MKNVDDDDDPLTKQAFKFLCRHLVAIRGTYVPVDEDGNPTGKLRGFAYSGFIVSIGDAWLIATAGHVLQDFESSLGKIKVGPCRIFDFFGPGQISHCPIPFDLVDAPKFYVYEDNALRLDGVDLGLDFGLILLNGNDRRLLEANNVVAVSETNMRTAANATGKRHVLIGFPECMQDEELLPDGRLAFTPAPVTAPVDQLDPSPEDLPQTEFPRFVGQLSDALDIDITGMSGGPILGFSEDASRYWVVAIQSTWLPKRKIIFGCPTPVFLFLVEQEFQRYQAERERPEP